MPKEFKDLTMKDDFLFGVIMTDETIAKMFLENLLETKISSITVESQKIYDESYDHKGVRLDIHIKDDAGTIYDIEMQQNENDNIPQRMRYYHGKIDTAQLAKGSNIKYNGLHKTYVIFICDFDIYNYGRCCYKFSNTSVLPDGTLIDFNDGSYSIILCIGGIGGVNNEIQSFMDYINCSDKISEKTESILVKEVHKRISEVKSNKELEGKYMDWADKMEQLNIEAANKAVKETILKSIKNMISKNYKDSDILDVIEGASQDDIDYVKKSLEENKL